MPPMLARKRLRSDSPLSEPPAKRERVSKPRSRHIRESVFQTLDAATKPKRTLSQTKAFLDQDDHDHVGALSDPASTDDDVEDVPLGSANKAQEKGKAPAATASDDSDGSDDEDWEDALGGHHHTRPDHGPTPVISGDIALTLSAAPTAAFESKPDGRKGASKTQRHIRNITHCMHVQCLMYHNLTRNAWVQDKEVQRILIQGMSPGCWRELERYWKDVGIRDGPSRLAAIDALALKPATAKTTPAMGRWKDSSSSRGVKLYESSQSKHASSCNDKKSKTVRNQGNETPKKDRKGCDWGATSEPLEPNTPNLSAGDPLLRLLRHLSAYWKAKFHVTAPSLRKRGYLSPAILAAEINAWKETPMHSDTFGERIENLEAFRELARKCEGSRDVGQQLFTALVRGLGIEARMVVSLQPVGFGWSQSEEGKAQILDKVKDAVKNVRPSHASQITTASKYAVTEPLPLTRKDISSVTEVDDSSDMSSAISVSSDADDNGRHGKKSPKMRAYSDELPYPTYWTEAISHLTHTAISISPLPRIIIASAASPDKLGDFYARGAAADKARQVLAYLIAFSSDGTAKDVTTRYLPRHVWPGRTKGVRMPVEKIPIHNKRGKVKRYEEWDWVKSLMRLYARPHSRREPWDEVEDEGDLVPVEPDKKKTMDDEGGKETLQGYKTSTEYVLERHLRREEALKPGAKAVRHFVSGRAGKEKSEPVYRRKDIVSCKTVESWHKEGRQIREGEQPLKFVKIRAVTVARKREIEERERLDGEKVQQGLYSKAQTDWIIPDPIVDGKIPRNAFGNIDIYVPTMVPRGAVHIPLRGTARICRKLHIDYAEACTGFEFGRQRAVPVITGVVVAEEHEDMVTDAWEVAEAEKAKKEADKREKLVLGMWKKFVSGLRIIERMKAEYGEDIARPADLASDALVPPKECPEPTTSSQWDIFHKHTDFEGGFLRDDAKSASTGPSLSYPINTEEASVGGFFATSQNEAIHGDLLVEHGEEKEDTRTTLAVMENPTRMPISLMSAAQNPGSEASDANAMELDADEDVEEGSQRSKPATPERRASKPRARGRLRGRGGRSSTRTSNLSPSESSDEKSEPDMISDPPPPPISSRSVPRRQAARKSEAQVKSHFFAEGSDGVTDLTDMTDRASPMKAKRAKRGATGRGRGRGRGR